MFNEGDLAIVTTRSGKEYVARYTLAPGIDYFWDAVIEGTGTNQFIDPDTHIELLKVSE